MAKKTYAIMGATGHIGSVIVQELLKEGHRVRALGRDQEKLQKLKEKGAEIISCSFDNEAALASAFKNCDAIFCFLPPAYKEEDMEAYQDKVGEAICRALKKSQEQRVINLSSIGADQAAGTGVIKILARQEKRLNDIPGLHVLHFRPGYFMENLLWQIPMIKAEGFNGSALKSDLPLPMIATQDIGKKVAELLEALEFTQASVFEYIGPKPVSLQEATKIIGKAIGKADLKYKQYSYIDAEKEMLARKVKPKTAKLILEMYQAINEGKIRLTQELTSENHGTTTIEAFATIFAKAYQKSEKHPELAHH